MKSIKWLAAATALAASSLSQAATYSWTFTDTASATLASGSLTASDTLNAVGGYDVLSISGTVAGFGAITGLVANPNQPNQFTMSGFIYDNVLFATSPHVTNSGILFTTSGATWNLYHSTSGMDAFTGYDGTVYIPDGGGVNFAGTFEVNAVPEPATWAMMIGGLGLAGVALRRRNRARLAAA